MSEQRVTDWIDGSVKPALPGVYQKLIYGDVVYAHWNGEFWGMHTGIFHHPKDALKDAKCRSMYQRAQWRGLAEDPNRVTHEAEALGDIDVSPARLGGLKGSFCKRRTSATENV